MRSNIPYYFCSACGHYLTVYRALSEAGLWSESRAPTREDGEVVLSRLKCTQCRSRDVKIVQKTEQRPTEKVIATDRGVGRVFHKPKCHYAAKIDLKDVIEFDTIQDAERQGYTPCGVCFGNPRKWRHIRR